MSEVFPMSFDCFTRLLVLNYYFVMIEYLPKRGMWQATLKGKNAPPHLLCKVNYNELVQLILVWDEYITRGGGYNNGRI